MKARLLAALAAFFISAAAHAANTSFLNAPFMRASEVQPITMIEGATATVATGRAYASSGKTMRFAAYATAGTYNATVTIYGTNVYCGSTCTSSSLGATSVDTLTSDGDTGDSSTYLYYFAAITSYTSGTLSVTMTAAPSSAGSTVAISQTTTDNDVDANTELPAAAAAADNFANPTTTNVMGMCMVWDGAAWDRCPGNSTSGMTVTIVDSSGDSAVDPTADAVKVLNYVSENDSPTGSPVTVAASATTVVNIDLGAVNGGHVLCDLENDNTANNRTIDAVDIYIGAASSVNGTSSTITLTELDFANPPAGGALAWVTTGAAGADRDATPDTSLDEDDHLKLYFDNLAGADNLTIQMTASGAGASVIPYCKTVY